MTPTHRLPDRTSDRGGGTVRGAPLETECVDDGGRTTLGALTWRALADHARRLPADPPDRDDRDVVACAADVHEVGEQTVDEVVQRGAASGEGGGAEPIQAEVEVLAPPLDQAVGEQ